MGESVSSGTGFQFVDVAYGTNIFVTVGSEGALMTSVTGSAWTKRTSPVTAGLNTVAFGLGHLD